MIQPTKQCKWRVQASRGHTSRTRTRRRTRTMSQVSELRVLVVTSDVSGDAHAADVVEALSKLTENGQVRVRVVAVAGPRTIEAATRCGVSSNEHCHVSTRGLSSIGIVHAIPLIRRAAGVLSEALKAAESLQPHCVLLVDFPGVNVTLASQLRRRRERQGSALPRILYYVPPNEWHVSSARTGEVVHGADEVLCVHPQEHAHFTEAARAMTGKATCSVEFVGHPVAARVERARAISPRDARLRLGVPEDGTKTVALLPASRMQEASHVWPVRCRESLRSSGCSQPSLKHSARASQPVRCLPLRHITSTSVYEHVATATMKLRNACTASPRMLPTQLQATCASSLWCRAARLSVSKRSCGETRNGFLSSTNRLDASSCFAVTRIAPKAIKNLLISRHAPATSRFAKLAPPDSRCSCSTCRR